MMPQPSIEKAGLNDFTRKGGFEVKNGGKGWSCLTASSRSGRRIFRGFGLDKKENFEKTKKGKLNEHFKSQIGNKEKEHSRRRGTP